MSNYPFMYKNELKDKMLVYYRMEKIEEQFQSDESFHVVKAVFFKNVQVEFGVFYSELKEYLGKYGKLIVATVGYEEEEVSRPHHHAHILVKQEGRIPHSLVTCFKSQSDTKYIKNTISLKKEQHFCIQSLKDILQYPLKENPLSELSFGLDEETFQKLHIDSKAIYDAEKRYKKKQKIKEQRKKDGWEKKVSWVKNNIKQQTSELTTLQSVATQLIRYYVEEEDANLPHKQKLEQEMIKYAIQETSVTIAEIIEKYYRI